MRQTDCCPACRQPIAHCGCTAFCQLCGCRTNHSTAMHRAQEIQRERDALYCDHCGCYGEGHDTAHHVEPLRR